MYFASVPDLGVNFDVEPSVAEEKNPQPWLPFEAFPLPHAWNSFFEMLFLGNNVTLEILL